jgi:predicted DNA-binding transcriptional regulator AlpA
MSGKKDAEKDDPFSSVNPLEFVRVESARRRAFIPLSNSACWEAIARGDLPPPIKLTPHGRASGWYVSTLVAHAKARLKAAQKAPAGVPQPDLTPKAKKAAGEAPKPVRAQAARRARVMESPDLKSDEDIKRAASMTKEELKEFADKCSTAAKDKREGQA